MTINVENAPKFSDVISMHDLFSTDTIYQIIYQFVFQLTLAVTAPVRQNSDIYWLYLICALVIAVIVSLSQVRNLIVGQTRIDKLFNFLKLFISKHFSKSLWTHPSALLDIRYYLVNAVVFPCVFAPLALQNDTVVNALNYYYLSINSVLGLNLGSIKSMVSDSSWFEVASFTNLSFFFDISLKLVYTIAFFVAYDAGRFIAHSLLHDVKWLWEFHKIHHSAEVLTPFTSFRVHPIDLMIMVSVPAITTGVVTWIFHKYFSINIDFYTFLNLHIFISIFNCIDNLRHWNVWVTYPAPFDKWFISPAHHQLHHSADQEHWGCNRGFELAIWDRLYKTIIMPNKTPMNIKLGLGDGSELSWRTLPQLYLNPFKSIFKSLYSSLKV